MSEGILLLLRIGLVLFCWNCVLMVWCYFMFWFLFVYQNVQLRLAGEYYMKSFMKTIFAIMCIKGVFALCVFGFFSVRRRRRRNGSSGGRGSDLTLPENPWVMGDGSSE